MKYFLSAILLLFAVGIAFGLITENTTALELENAFVDIVSKFNESLSFVGSLGRSAVAFFQKTVGVVQDIGGKLFEWLGSGWAWFVDLFN